MGFCYQGQGRSRKLCCDFCGGTVGTRKVPCPHGWCQALATCTGCRKLGKHKLANDGHQGCKVSHDKLAQAKASLTAGGLTLAVHVGGTNDDGSEYFRLTDDQLGFAASYLFSKAWLDAPDLAHLESLGHIVVREVA
jgi:hypothetical protein